MATLRPLKYVAHRLLGKRRTLSEAAYRSWTLEADSVQDQPPAIHLGGLERVSGVAVMSTLEDQLQCIRGGLVRHGALVAHELRDVTIVDGSVFSNTHRMVLNPDSPLLSWRMLRSETLDTYSLGSTFCGNQFFGHWLTDDLPLTLLASEHAPVLSTQITPSIHPPEYLALSSLDCRRVILADVRSLIVFDDISQGPNKRARYQELRLRLNAGRIVKQDHVGVYLWRGESGVKRLLINEDEIADRFRQQGFRIVHPQTMTALQILDEIRGAHTIVSVEGSHMLHALYAMAEGGAFLTLQPPYRFSNVIKHYADTRAMTQLMQPDWRRLVAALLLDFPHQSWWTQAEACSVGICFLPW